MKDYSNFDNYKKFILSYKIIENKIIVKLASGEDYIIPYTKENEQKIINKMEVQIMNIRLKPISNFDKFAAIINFLTLPLAISNFINYGGIFYAFILSVIAVNSIYYPLKWINYERKRKDIEKLKMFLDNKKELNNSIEKNNNMLLGINSKIKKEIKLQENMGKEPINVNNIDNYTLNDLKKLRDNLLRIKEFDFKEDNVQNEKCYKLKK